MSPCSCCLVLTMSCCWGWLCLQQQLPRAHISWDMGKAAPGVSRSQPQGSQPACEPFSALLPVATCEALKG